MTSIDDRDHREQEDEKDEWETGWEYPDHMQEALRAPQWISNRPKGLEDADRLQDLIDPPALRALRRMDQIAAGNMPPWLAHVQRTEEMLKRAQGLWPGLDAMQRQHDQMMTTLGYIKVRRRRYAQPTSSRPRPSPPPAAQPSSPPPMVEACEPDTATVISQKRGRGRRPGHRTINAMHFDRLMRAYCVENSKTPSRREFQVFAALKYKTVDRRRLTDYAHDYCQTDWSGVRRRYGQLFGVE